MFFIRDQDGDLHDITGGHLFYKDGFVRLNSGGYTVEILEAPEKIGRRYISATFTEMVRLGHAIIHPEKNAPAIAGQLAREKAESLEVPDVDPED